MRLHTGNNFCGVAQNLQVFYPSFIGSKPFSCPYCQDLFFRTSGMKKKHLIKAHGFIPPAAASSAVASSTSAVASSTSAVASSTSAAAKGLTTSFTRLSPAVEKEAVAPLTTSQSLFNVSVPASSLSTALDTVANAGVPLVGSTIRLQLDGKGFNSAITHLQVNQDLLMQLKRGGNINILIDSSIFAAENDGYKSKRHVSAKSTSNKVAAAVDSSPFNCASKNAAVACPLCPHRKFESLEERTQHMISTHASDGQMHRDDKKSISHLEQIETTAIQQVQSLNKLCPICSKMFSKPSQLSRHMRIHTGEKTYVCNVCKKTFNQKNSLQCHMKRHQPQEERQHFVCPFCAYPFTLKCNLKTHLNRTHSSMSQEFIPKNVE
jgi:uncharacterized C2H2 Zn-finger protein